MLITKHPFRKANSFPLDNWMNAFFDRDISAPLGHDAHRAIAPAVNITENKDAFNLSLVAPGFAKEDLKLSVEDDTLTISAEHKAETLDEGQRYTRREFARSAFRRSFQLPNNVNADGISAEYRNGILTVNIPKAEAEKPKTKEIRIA